MAFAVRRSIWTAAVMAVVAAFVWSTYYFFVLGAGPGLTAAAFVPYPFLVGGVCYTAWCVREGHGREFLTLWTQPDAWGRVALILAMQLSVLAGTYAAGAVDTALLSLVGDVVLTPILLIVLFGEGRSRTRSVAFVLGMVLSTGGATLTILGGGSAEPIQGWGWLIAFAVPIAVAVYFLASARASRKTPMTAVVGQATLAGGVAGLFLAPLLPGGVHGLLVTSPVDVGVLVALGVSSFFFAPLLYFRAIELAGLMLPALLMATIPVFTLFLSLAVLGTIPPWLAILGVPIAVVGAIFALQGDHTPWSPEYGDRAAATK
ncbi:MAG: DMT family transporter [Thermoplasmata archaeon]|nr:DMT family transporter [Thermoplasmata archaeon]